MSSGTPTDRYPVPMSETETLPRRSERRPGKRRGSARRRSLLILLAIIVLMAVLALAARSYYQWASSGSGPKSPVTVVIPQGATGGEVADLLKAKQVIHSTFVFKVALRLKHLNDSGFEAGEYHLTTNMSVEDAIAALGKGPIVHAVRVTIPEGLTVEQTGSRVAANIDSVSQKGFVRAARNAGYPQQPYFPKKGQTLEGLLFPNTYDFLKNSSARDVVGRLLDEFQQETASLPWENANKLHLTPYEVVIVASMIEREARFQGDRQKVARVIYNRLAKDMRLQIDATVQYALGKTKPELTYADLKVESPYNTYLHGGLPPTPIANPSLASLRAALQPASGPWLYYLVVDKAGHEFFTDSYAEFSAKKAQVQG
jgi:UPF0755 protein